MDLTFRLYAPASFRWGIRPSTTVSMKVSTHSRPQEAIRPENPSIPCCQGRFRCGSARASDQFAPAVQCLPASDSNQRQRNVNPAELAKAHYSSGEVLEL